MSEAQCPKARLHTKCPPGYLDWHAWAEKKSRTHVQVVCSGCGLYKIWKRKPKQDLDTEAN